MTLVRHPAHPNPEGFVLSSSSYDIDADDLPTPEALDEVRALLEPDRHAQAELIAHRDGRQLDGSARSPRPWRPCWPTRCPVATDPRGLPGDAPLLDAWLRFQERPPTRANMPIAVGVGVTVALALN